MADILRKLSKAGGRRNRNHRSSSRLAVAVVIAAAIVIIWRPVVSYTIKEERGVQPSALQTRLLVWLEPGPEWKPTFVTCIGRFCDAAGREARVEMNVPRRVNWKNICIA